MERWFHLYFQGKNEHSDTEKGFLELPVGNLMFSFLDIEWENILKILSEKQESSVVFTELTSFFSEAHPFFLTQLDRLKRNDEPVSTAIQWVNEMILFYKRLRKLLLTVLDTEGEYSQLSTTQRYHLLLQTSAQSCVFAQSMYDMVSIQNRISENGRRTFALVDSEVTDELIAEAEESEPQSYIFFCADDIRPLIYLSFEHMVNKNISIRKCAHCGRYFVPTSENAIYCSRIDPEEGKACKEFASKKKYNERIHDDAAVSMYRKNLNKLNMRTKRAPAVYKPEAFEEWSKAAKQALEDFRNKKISEEEFYRIIEVPPIKGS